MAACSENNSSKTDSLKRHRFKRPGSESQGKKLRYVGKLNAGGEASVGLDMVEAGHAFRNINLTDNIVQFVTDRYSSNPLVVQGPGAGPAVTAGGIFADLLRLATYLGGGD